MTDLTGKSADRLLLLQTFVRIVEAGSLSAAAVQLGTTQPTVSRRLQQLEKGWGLPLLQRSTHSMSLTDDGERFFAQARDLLERWAALDADLAATRDEPRGTLRVLAPSAFGQDRFVTPVIELLQRHPQLQIEWLLHDRMPDFIAEGLDCAVRVGEVDQPGVVAALLARLPRIVVAAPRLLGAGGVPSSPEALGRLPWVAMRTFYQSEVALHHRDGQRVEMVSIQPRFSTDNLQALRHAVLAGVGVGIASAWAVEADLREGRLVQVAPDWAASALPIYMVYPHANFYPARLRAFVAAMREHVPRLSEVWRPEGLGEG